MTPQRKGSSSIATLAVWGAAYIWGGKKGLAIAIVSGTVMSVATLHNLDLLFPDPEK